MKFIERTGTVTVITGKASHITQFALVSRRGCLVVTTKAQVQERHQTVFSGATANTQQSAP